jgi:hypothetical protein
MRITRLKKNKRVTIHSTENRFYLVYWVLKIIYIYGFISAFEGGTTLKGL